MVDHIEVCNSPDFFFLREGILSACASLYEMYLWEFTFIGIAGISGNPLDNKHIALFFKQHNCANESQGPYEYLYGK